MASILVVSGPQQGALLQLQRRSVLVGRAEDATLQLLDETVSRRHLEIRFDEAARRYLARDLSSANGTRLNDRPLEGEAPLADGDLLALGATELMFSAVDFPDTEAALARHRRRGERARSTIIGPPGPG